MVLAQSTLHRKKEVTAKKRKKMPKGTGPSGACSSNIQDSANGFQGPAGELLARTSEIISKTKEVLDINTLINPYM